MTADGNLIYRGSGQQYAIEAPAAETPAAETPATETPAAPTPPTDVMAPPGDLIPGGSTPTAPPGPPPPLADLNKPATPMNQAGPQNPPGTIPLGTQSTAAGFDPRTLQYTGHLFGSTLGGFKKGGSVKAGAGSGKGRLQKAKDADGDYDNSSPREYEGGGEVNPAREHLDALPPISFGRSEERVPTPPPRPRRPARVPTPTPNPERSVGSAQNAPVPQPPPRPAHSPMMYGMETSDPGAGMTGPMMRPTPLDYMPPEVSEPTFVPQPNPQAYPPPGPPALVPGRLSNAIRRQPNYVTGGTFAEGGSVEERMTPAEGYSSVNPIGDQYPENFAANRLRLDSNPDFTNARSSLGDLRAKVNSIATSIHANPGRPTVNQRQMMETQRNATERSTGGRTKKC